MRFSFCTALSQWENQLYVEQNFIERLVYRVTELQLDIVWKATWCRAFLARRRGYG